jgi:hypothetical protein
MRSTWRLVLSTAALAALAIGLGAGRAAEVPYAGNWKIILLQGLAESTQAILRIQEKGGKALASVSVPGGEATIENLKVDAKSIRFTLAVKGGRTLEIAAYPPAETGAKVNRIFGSMLLGRQYVPLILEKTDATEVDVQNANVPTEGTREAQKILDLTDDKEKETRVKAFLEKHTDKPIALYAAQGLVQLRLQSGAGSAELAGTAELTLKAAAVYGPEFENQVTVAVCRAFLTSEKGTPVTIDLASRALKRLGDNAPAAQAEPVVKVLIAALKKAGKGDEVSPLEERLAKLDDQLDVEFLKTAIPFKPRTFTGRSAKSERVAVVELFTGAQCPPCVAADIAFDAALKAYKPTDVLLLQYHLHVPGPDPLTNADSEARALYYGDGQEGMPTPVMFLDGKLTPQMGGPPEAGEERFDILRKLVSDRLEAEAGAKLTLTATRNGDKISLRAEAADLKRTGAKVNLRFVLIEDVARYPGRNGQRLHHHVVRAFPGGVQGFALKEKTAKQEVSVDLETLRRALTNYLSKPTMNGPYIDDERPLGLKHLKAVAFIQDDESKEILQAVQVEVPEAK